MNRLPNRYAFSGLLVAALLLLTAGHLLAATVARDQAAALAAAARQEQQRLESSGFLYREPQLETYLQGIVQRLSPGGTQSGQGFRVRIIKNPFLNAFTYPDGVCYVHTGILARLENEDQLAALLGHELAHYLLGHAIKGMRHVNRLIASSDDARDVGGRNGASHLEQMRDIEAAWSSYRMDAEFEADRESLKMMLRAGYNPEEALRLLEHLMEEMDREGLQEPLFLGSHPRLKDRMEACKDRLSSLSKAVQRAADGSRFAEKMRTVVLENIELDIRAGRFTQALGAAERYRALQPEAPQVHYLLGEIHRQQSCDVGSARLAETCFKRAIELNADYPAPHRALGLMYYKAGEARQAREHLEASLSLDPQAPENGYIQHYLKRLQP